VTRGKNVTRQINNLCWDSLGKGSNFALQTNETRMKKKTTFELAFYSNITCINNANKRFIYIEIPSIIFESITS